METGQPSRTAFAAAAHRAAHQILEGGSIFTDPLAMRILGDPELMSRYSERASSKDRMRLFIAIRTRFAEDALAAALAGGLRQIVVLGAGLDTYAYRTGLPTGVRIFEVDYPATQKWKRERLIAAEIAIPISVVFAPVNFEKETLAEGLAAADFDNKQETFFTWLGVVPYLTKEAIWSTLRWIGSLPGGAHVVFDYANPPASLPPELRERHEERPARVAAVGEAWLSYFEENELHAKLREFGFSQVEDLGPDQIVCRYFPGRIHSPGGKGGHVLRASRPANGFDIPEAAIAPARPFPQVRASDAA